MLAYLIAQEGGGGRLTWVDFSGRKLATIGEKSSAYSPELSPDGRRASVLMGDPNNDVWVHELSRGPDATHHGHPGAGRAGLVSGWI